MEGYNMKIAIHNSPGSFSSRWISYCREKKIPYKVVNAYDSDIIKQLDDCDIFMWHHHHANYKDALFAKQLLFSLQTSGKKVFPDFNTGWHFDDKVGQKYLLESIKAPLVPSYVFYSRKDALEWIESTTFPKVFKLRGGAGATNVKLVHSRYEARKIITKAFGKGFSQFNALGNFKDTFKSVKKGNDNILSLLKAFYRLFVTTDFSKMHSREKGYVYFQDFIPNNKFDIRIVIVDNKAFALKRICRENDFRASGSGNIIYSQNEIDVNCVKIAFDVNAIIKSSSIAFDFVFDENNNPLIVELSYGYSVSAYDECEGFWDSNLKWHEGSHFDFCGWMVEEMLRK